MSHHTIETVRDTIAALREQGTVYKVEVDELKYAFSHAFDADKDRVKDTTYFAVPSDSRSEADRNLFWTLPYEARHWYGKRFSNFLIDCPDSAFKDAVVSHRNRWKPLFDALQELITRQVKGRRPAAAKKVIGTRIQLRATCACCFRDQAVSGDRMVAHGYTLDYGFQNGNCYGAGKPHFGTEAGVAFTKDLITNVRSTAASAKRRAEGAAKGEVKPVDRKTRARIDNPTPMQVRALIESLENEARQATYHADQMQKMVDGWKSQDPREVEVEITE